MGKGLSHCVGTSKRQAAGSELPLIPTPPEGSLYSATAADFQASDAVVYRSLGSQPPLRSAKYDSKWLRGQSSWGSDRLGGPQACVGAGAVCLWMGREDGVA